MRSAIAWVGLGLIGLPMAARLAAAGHRVRGFDIDPARMAMAVGRGIVAAGSLEEVLAGAGLVFTSLPTEEALGGVAPEYAATAPAGAILVETSTIGPKVSAEVARVLGGRPYLRAPISGSTTLAEAGTLSTFVSGPRAAFESAREAMQAYTRAQIWLGEAEEARYAKLAVNLMVAATAGMMGEALALARKGGIGWEAALELIGESAVASPLVKYKLDPLRRRDFAPAATNALVMKDLDLALKAAGDAGVPLPIAAHMQAVYRGVLASDLAAEDFFSIVKLAEREAGLGEP